MGFGERVGAPKAEHPASASKVAEVVFVVALALPLAVRAVASSYPGAWLWGFDSLRYLPAWAWLLWIIPAAAIALGWSKKREEAAGKGDEGSALLLALAGATALAVLLLPDRVQFVGDFLLRQGTSEEALPPATLFPQALPLDVALHVAFPMWAKDALGFAPTVASRILDALEAGALAALAHLFARRAGLSGAARLAAAVLLAWGGWLGIFTGYSKAFTEMCLLMLAAAVWGTDALRGSRAGFFLLCATVAAGFALHRSAAGFLPALAFVAWAQWNPSRAAPAKKTKKEKAPLVPTWMPLLLPLVAMALALPRMLSSASQFDTAHFAARGESAGSVLAHVVSPGHLLDLANLILFLVPLALLALVPAPGGRTGPFRGREWIFFLLLGAPFWLVALVLRPAQGIPRDFDDFAPAAVALSVVVTAHVAGLWRSSPRLARFAVAAAAGAVAPVLCFLLLHADLERGLVRANALVDGPPLRGESERALWREYLGARYHRAKRYREAAKEFEQAAVLAPSPNILASWGIASRRAGDSASEERAFTLLLERAPADRIAVRAAALTGLGRLALERGDSTKARDLVAQALVLDPRDDDARALARRLDPRFP